MLLHVGLDLELDLGRSLWKRRRSTRLELRACCVAGYIIHNIEREAQDADSVVLSSWSSHAICCEKEKQQEEEVTEKKKRGGELLPKNCCAEKSASRIQVTFALCFTWSEGTSQPGFWKTVLPSSFFPFILTVLSWVLKHDDHGGGTGLLCVTPNRVWKIQQLLPLVAACLLLSLNFLLSLLLECLPILMFDHITINIPFCVCLSSLLQNSLGM